MLHEAYPVHGWTLNRKYGHLLLQNTHCRPCKCLFSLDVTDLIGESVSSRHENHVRWNTCVSACMLSAGVLIRCLMFA